MKKTKNEKAYKVLSSDELRKINGGQKIRVKLKDGSYVVVDV